ncbi:hypothetical protein [Stigmatella hybrida]|uniref:hypothetical protein n=1 Tax=Stigmatella hybrida TaxID=394097 RepID=UPI001CDA949A|nr:hypothetical protein [Stigmatella hybrida]
MDDVRWDPAPAPFLKVPPYARGESFHLTELRELLQAAKHNDYLAWEDPGGLNRAQAVAVLACTHARRLAAPAKSPGPLFDQPNPQQENPMSAATKGKTFERRERFSQGGLNLTQLARKHGLELREQNRDLPGGLSFLGLVTLRTIPWQSFSD